MKALSIEKLNKTYENGVQALKGISFEVQKGDFFALLGPNGAGKSTTIGIMTSLVRATQGDAKIFGKSIKNEPDEAKKHIGVVPQEVNLNIFEKCFDILVQQAGYYGIPRATAVKRAKQLLKEMGLYDKRNEKSQNLSGGMKRKLMIARALMHKPRLLLLDEPTAGVDVETRRVMWSYFTRLNKNGTTIILTTHYLEEAEQLCKNIAIINKGELMANTSMRSFLKKLDKETFVLDVNKLPKSMPKIRDVTLNVVDDMTLEATLPAGKNLNTLFDKLSQKGIEVKSMRNKANRLEELFVELTKNE